MGPEKLFLSGHAQNYQISQYDQPICEGGQVEIEMPGDNPSKMGPHRMVELTRIHLEEDVGKLTHYEQDSLVDYNRADVPAGNCQRTGHAYPDEVFAYLPLCESSSPRNSACDMEKDSFVAMPISVCVPKERPHWAPKWN